MLLRRGLLALGLTLGCLGLVAPSAGAVLFTLPNGKMISFLPTRGKAKRLGLPAASQIRSAHLHSAASSATTTDAVNSNVDYGGGPVMSSNTNYVIYWAPSGTTPYPREYQSGLAQYFNDLAHDSGGNQNSDSVSAQYNDVTGSFANYQSYYGGSFVDTDPYPTSQCPSGAVSSGTPCLIDSQLQAELQSYLSAHNLPENINSEYFLVFPPGVENCIDNTTAYQNCSADTNGTSPAYCAYHTAVTGLPGNKVIVYANDPYVNDDSCQTGQWPNGPSDGLIDGGLSHEHNESITDPIPNTGWTDFEANPATGAFEIGDKCVSSTGAVYGTPLGGSGTASDPYYNQVINGHHYYYQEEWSNATAQCAQRAVTSSEAQPTATFSSASSAPPAGAMTFNATGSTNETGGDFQWEFEDPDSVNYDTTSSLESPSTNPVAAHPYTVTGAHTVSLTVFRSDGTSFATSRIVHTGKNGPTSSFTTSTSSPTTAQPVTFTNTSTAGSAAISTESWNFGDGTSATAATPSPHTYATAGTYVVTLTVTDTLGQTASAYRTITVSSPITGSFTSSPDNPQTGTPVSFDATGLQDSAGTLTSYQWNFGDGSTDTGASPSPHTYSSPGTYTVTLTAGDGTNSNTFTAHVTVTDPPTAGFTVPTVAPIRGLPVAFNGAGSSVPSGDIVSYSWDFGDGPPVDTTSSYLPVHTYSAAGTYTVSLTVTDNNGHTSQVASQQVVVSDPPHALFTTSTPNPRAGTAVSFDASDSSGAKPLSYSWSFGDGATDSTSGAQPSHVYGSPGTYTVLLTVTDKGGHQSTASHSVTVAPAPPPPPRQGIPTAVIGVGSAHPVARVALPFRGSASRDSGSTLTSYRWSFGDGGTSSSANPTHTYGKPGRYTVRLTVIDATGSQQTSSRTVQVRAASITGVKVKTGRRVEQIRFTISGPGTLILGKRRVRVGRPRTYMDKLKLSGGQRAQLSARRPLQIRFTATFKPWAGSTSRRTVRFKVKP